jgi:hypothetical protein
MHTADALKSDPDFAGLMITCREKAALQVGLVVIRPFPPRSHPRITIRAARSTARFQATVLPTGSVLSLPNEAEALLTGPWRSARELTVDIEGDGAAIHGIVGLENLTAAIAALKSNCPLE